MFIPLNILYAFVVEHISQQSIIYLNNNNCYIYIVYIDVKKYNSITIIVTISFTKHVKTVAHAKI